MKQKYIHMCILIQGPKQPGIDIHLYLGLLKEELDSIWKNPPRTWDTYTEDYFDMSDALLTTVHVYPCYAYVAPRSATDSAGVSGAWIRPRISSYQGILGLRKPCFQGLEGGFAWITRGENTVICLMEKMRKTEPRSRIAT